MAIVDLIMPKLGESIMEATILKWTKKPGDQVKQDETVLEIATDKVDSEVPSTAEGTLAEIFFNENDVVPIGTVIARIETEANAPAQQAPPNTEPPTWQTNQTAISSLHGNVEEEEEETFEEAAIPYMPAPAQSTGNEQANNGFFSPLVLNIAKGEGVPLSELEHIAGTGNEGRVTKKDILQYVSDKKAGKKPAQAARPATQPVAIQAASVVSTTPKPVLQPTATAKVQPASAPTPKTNGEVTNHEGENVEIVEMDRMRKMIAKHMVNSKQTSPHVTSFAEADVTNMVLWREKNKIAFEKTEGTRITFMPMFIECLTRIIKLFPYVNASVEGENILLKKNINIGMATALPNGNLIVPVIRNADYLNLVGLSKSINGLADAARNNKLKPDDTAGGTFTFTNVGTFGSLMGTPIINQPQVAILAVGAIKKRPVVLETPEGDAIGIRHMMYLSLSYDHRIVDGSIGASFLTRVAKEFESWELDRHW